MTACKLFGIKSLSEKKLQEEMEEVYYNRITFPDSDDDENPIQSAMVIMDYEGRLVGQICRTQ